MFGFLIKPTTIDITPKINIIDTNIHKIVTLDKKLVINIATPIDIKTSAITSHQTGYVASVPFLK